MVLLLELPLVNGCTTPCFRQLAVTQVPLYSRVLYPRVTCGTLKATGNSSFHKTGHRSSLLRQSCVRLELTIAVLPIVIFKVFLSQYIKSAVYSIVVWYAGSRPEHTKTGSDASMYVMDVCRVNDLRKRTTQQKPPAKEQETRPLEPVLSPLAMRVYLGMCDELANHRHVPLDCIHHYWVTRLWYHAKTVDMSRTCLSMITIHSS